MKIECLICNRKIHEDFIQEHYDEHKSLLKGEFEK